MNFFKSVFLDEPDSPTSPNPNSTETEQPTSPDKDESEYESDPDQPDSNPSPSWGFGGLLKTLQVKSDWIDTYRRDLEEFGSGLKKETEILREVASKAVKDLPTSVDSIGSNVWKSTAEIIAQGKESLLTLSDDTDSPDTNSNALSVNNSAKYSRFDAQLRVIQSDLSTYVEDPDDLSEYVEWKSGFDLGEKSEEIEGLMKENGSIDGIYKRVVPNSVDHDVFWCRYYFRVYKLKQAENLRAELVKRAISTEDEEELSWDVDEEEEEDVKKVGELSPNESNVNLGGKDSKENVEDGDSANKEVPKKEVQSEGTPSACGGEVLEKSEEKVTPEGKTESIESVKESDISTVSTQPLVEVEDDGMGWDEIEDIGSEDEKKATLSGSPNRTELKKRLSASVDDDDEDLSWDIEDDDEPVKY